MKSLLALLLSIALFVGCKNSDPKSISDSTELSTARQASLKVSGQELQVKLTDVKDGRCPADVVCIWGGVANVYFTVSEGTASAKAEVEFGAKDQNKPNGKFTLNGINYQLVVEELLPYPYSSKTYTIDEYQVKVKVERQ